MSTLLELQNNAYNYMMTVDESIPMPKPFEVWVYLIWDNIILYRYAISSYGRLYDFERQSLVEYSVDKDGYYMASITVDNIGYKKIRVHRWELLSFWYNEDYKELIANHKDGNKQNLWIGNLEWTTSIDNTRHAWDHGLNNNIGINNGNGKYDDDIIHRICELIQQGLTNAQICTAFGLTVKEERMRFNATISGIRLGKCHRSIASGYEFLSGTNTNNRYSLTMAELVCQFLSDPIANYTYKDIMDILNIPNEQRESFKVYINDLLRGRTAKSVTMKYNLIKPSEGKSATAYLMR